MERRLAGFPPISNELRMHSMPTRLKTMKMAVVAEGFTDQARLEFSSHYQAIFSTLIIQRTLPSHIHQLGSF
jgi:hypothetical protein